MNEVKYSIHPGMLNGMWQVFVKGKCEHQEQYLHLAMLFCEHQSDGPVQWGLTTRGNYDGWEV